jgi:hypothetical protein
MRILLLGAVLMVGCSKKGPPPGTPQLTEAERPPESPGGMLEWRRNPPAKMLHFHAGERPCMRYERGAPLTAQQVQALAKELHAAGIDRSMLGAIAVHAERRAERIIKQNHSHRFENELRMATGHAADPKLDQLLDDMTAEVAAELDANQDAMRARVFARMSAAQRAAAQAFVERHPTQVTLSNLLPVASALDGLSSP